ncbi:MAG: inorganic phosphate transporter [Planctomycetota bacterium]
MAWNIGANDVANAMGTSVGSGALTLKKAIILAGIFEFCGAFFVGSNVAETIRKGIVPVEAFTRPARVRRVDPSGPGPALTPTSTTAPARATTGPGRDADNAVKEPVAGPVDPATDALGQAARKLAIGMLAALLAAALWLNVATFFGQPVSTTHAIIGAVVGFAIVAAGPASVRWLAMGKIAASWLISPLAGGAAAYVIYGGIRRFVLRHRHPVHMAKAAVPFCFGAIVFIIALSILYKGLPRLRLNMPLKLAAPLALMAAFATAAPARAVIERRTRNRRVRRAERYNVVEGWFGYIQTVTACFMAFAHGANDVANAIGPLAGVVHFARGGLIGTRTSVPAWLLAMGGVAIVVGLATYGYKVIYAVGRKITEITPTRGFSAEFATASTVLLCSKMGLPISTTFVLVGSVMGVGLARGFGAIDMKVIRRILTSWVVTIPIAAVFSAIFYVILQALSG